jgi:hypothetical protein
VLVWATRKDPRASQAVKGRCALWQSLPSLPKGRLRGCPRILCAYHHLVARELDALIRDGWARRAMKSQGHKWACLEKMDTESGGFDV